jgi:hypothetical protein
MKLKQQHGIDGISAHKIQSEPPVNTVPSSATSYSKISNSGATLSDSAKLDN